MDADGGDAEAAQGASRDDSFDPDAAAALGAPGQAEAARSVRVRLCASDTPGCRADGSVGWQVQPRNCRRAIDDTRAATLRLPSTTPKDQPGGTVTPNGIR